MQPNPRRSLPFARIYRQRRTASLCHCLSPLKKKRRQASGCLLRLSTLSGQHTAPLMPVDCLKSGNHLHSDAASCPSLLFNPAVFFSTTSFGSAFCLGKGALCNTCQHQLVVPGLQVSAAFRDRRHTNSNLFISIFLAAGRSICCHCKPFTPQPLTASRLRRSG